MWKHLKEIIKFSEGNKDIFRLKIPEAIKNKSIVEALLCCVVRYLIINKTSDIRIDKLFNLTFLLNSMRLKLIIIIYFVLYIRQSIQHIFSILFLDWWLLHFNSIEPMKVCFVSFLSSKSYVLLKQLDLKKKLCSSCLHKL